jgi:hypothetical protein
MGMSGLADNDDDLATLVAINSGNTNMPPGSNTALSKPSSTRKAIRATNDRKPHAPATADED